MKLKASKTLSLRIRIKIKIKIKIKTRQTYITQSPLSVLQISSDQSSVYN
jgi:hypothetical protein